MADIILRQSNVIPSTGGTIKGTPLTNAEVDNNFANLNVASNSIESNIGFLTNLTTSTTANIVDSINEVQADVDNVQSNVDTLSSSLSSNVSLLSSNISAVDSNVGILSQLTTTQKDNVVSSINEVRILASAGDPIPFAIALG